MHRGRCRKHKINASEPILLSTIQTSLRFADRPSPFFEFVCEALHAVKTKEHAGLVVTGRRKLVGGDGVVEEHQGGHAQLFMAFSMACGGLQWPGHAHAWHTEAQLLRRWYYGGRGDRKRAQEGRRELWKEVPRLAWSGGA